MSKITIPMNCNTGEVELHAMVSLSDNIEGLKLDPSNYIADITFIVGDLETGIKYKKFGKVILDELITGKVAISFTTKDDSWIEIPHSESVAQASDPLVGILEPAI